MCDNVKPKTFLKYSGKERSHMTGTMQQLIYEEESAETVCLSPLML